MAGGTNPATIMPNWIAISGVRMLQIPKPARDAIAPAITATAATAASKPTPTPRRELRQVVKAELLLNGGRSVHVLLEPLPAEQPVFPLFELLAECVVFVTRDDLPKFGEAHRIFG